MKWYKKLGYEVARYEDVDLMGKTGPCWGMMRPAKRG